MKLLVTNDDGIKSVFFHALVHALKAAGHELYVVAPLTEQSWTGASKTRHRAVQSAAADHGFGCPTWTVDGTPSDCVNIAIAHLLPTKVDAVVSGINVGFNCTLGFIIASGTVSAALEGALHGLPAMAFSQDVSEGGLLQPQGTRRPARRGADLHAAPLRRPRSAPRRRIAARDAPRAASPSTTSTSPSPATPTPG
jgi:5'/3'-nucleotidase SurE